MTNFTEKALEFAQQHVRSYYASDFFPDSDEFDSVWADWDQVVSHFKHADAGTLGTTPEDMACAKATGGFRIVHQLQPLDTLAYTALASIIAPHLEAARIPEAEGVACSYRLDPDQTGRFFKANANGYTTYRNRSLELSQTASWVFVADIAGFYNHIYVHRVQGAAEQLDKALVSVASDLHDLLLNLNDSVSIGIPVGPAASIIVSELILNEVDHFLRGHRTRPVYTRYVDDYRFFSNSRADLEILWHDLACFLYRAHRLTLANAKCRIISTSEFRDKFLLRKTDAARRERARTLDISFADIENEYASDSSSESGLEAKKDLDAKKAALEGFLDEVLSDPELNIGLARKILRRARSLRMRCIARPVIDNLERLAPVIRDAGLYLSSVMSRSAITHNAQRLESFLAANRQFASQSHLHYWAAWLMSGKASAAELAGYDGFIDSALPRFRARSSRVLGKVSWVRDNRAQWQRWATWDRWSLLHSAELLPSAERRAWMNSVAKSPDLMDRLIAAKVRSL